MKNRFLQAPLDIRVRLKQGIKSRTVSGTICDNDNAILIAGCKEGQTSADAYFSGRYNGALTYNILKALKNKKDITYKQLELVLTVAMEQGGFAQTPIIVGKEELLNRKIFN